MAEPPDERSLTRRATIGAAWLVASRWGMRLIGLVSTIVLARWLTPEDFGIVVLAGLIVGLLDTLTDFRFGQALVHFQDASNDEYNTAWTFNVLRGTVVAAILVIGAWLFAALFKEPRLIPVFWVLGLIALLDALQNIGTIQFTKDMRFDLDFRLRISQKLSSFIVTIALAFFWRNYWALVAGMVAGSTARLILSYAMHPYRPRLCVTSWRRLFAFSAWLMGAQVISLINQRLEQFLIGGFLSARLVGVYNLAYELAAMATSELVGPASQALFPGFSKVAHDKERLRQAYEKSVQFVVAIGTPLGIGLALVAPEFVMIVLGPKWAEAVDPLRVLSVMFAVSVLAMTSNNLLQAMGRTRDVFMIDLILFVVRVPVTVLTIWQFGFAGAAWVRFAAAMWWVCHTMVAVRNAIGISFQRIFLVTWRSYAAMSTMVVVVQLAEIAVSASETAPITQAPLSTIWVAFVVKALAGAASYVFAHLLFWRLQGCPDGPESSIISIVKSRFRTVNK